MSNRLSLIDQLEAAVENMLANRAAKMPARLLAGLTESEAKALRERFGIDPTLSPEDLAKQFEATQDRIRKLEEKARKRFGSDVKLEDVERQFSATRERIREIEAKAWRKLQERAGELQPMLGIAADLCDLPRTAFLGKLALDLKREGAAMAAVMKPVRSGFHTLTPYITVEKAPELVEFMKRAFGAQETLRTEGSAGGFHIEVRLGEDMLMIGSGGPEPQGPSRPTALHYFVSDVDGTYERALQNGAISLLTPVDQPYGVREASVRDPIGNNWYISTPMKDEQGHEYFGLRSVACYLHPKGADRLIEFLKHGLGAEAIEVHRSAHSGVVEHAKLRIVDSMIELSEAHGPWQPMPTSFFVYVNDPESLYRKALDAGATALSPMETKPHGRGGGVLDEQGNRWYIFTPRGNSE